MKRFVLLLLCIFALSCNKNKFCEPNNQKAPDAEVAALEAYLTNNGINTTKDSRGFFYIIDEPGSGKKPTICSTVAVAYTGKFLDGRTFDSSNGVSFSLQRLIVGWQQAIPLIAKGGKIKLYLPPSLAYGSGGSGSIPGNTNLYFEISLLDL